MKVIINAGNRTRTVVYSSAPECKLRPVVEMKDGFTAQAAGPQDITVMKVPGSDELFIRYGMTCPPQQAVLTELPFVSQAVAEFLVDDCAITLPAEGDWDGQTTMVSQAYDLKLDLFFSAIDTNTLIQGLLNITLHPDEAFTGTINTNRMTDTAISDLNVTTPHLFNRLVGNLDTNYYEWLCAKKPLVSTQAISWRYATGLPKTVSVCALKYDNGKYRYNDLIVYRKDAEPEVINVFDIMSSFKFLDDNLLVLPYRLDENVTRVLYILHDESLDESHQALVWAFKKR